MTICRTGYSVYVLETTTPTMPLAREGYPKEAYWDPCCSFSTFETCPSVFYQQSQTLSMRPHYVIMLEATHSSQATLCQSLSTAVTALAQWLEDRGLLVNDRKTQVMIIQPRGNSASPPPVLRGDKPIPTVHSVRYLGVIVDDGLSWKSHVDSVTKEVWKAIGALWRSRRLLTKLRSSPS